MNRIPCVRWLSRLVGVVVCGAALVAGAASPVVAQEAAADGPRCAHWWVGHEEAIEQVLLTGEVVRMEAIPVGVTKPRRAYFAAGSPVGSMAWKVMPLHTRRGYDESHRAEVAAYRLSRLLDLHMVPPVVERRIGRERGAAVMWIDGVGRWDVRHPARAPMRTWSHQVSRMKLFDQLIANIDRNQGNLLQDADGHLFLIDHSRAFGTRRSLKGLEGPTQVDRRLWTRIEALTRADIEAAVGDMLTHAQVSALLARRDAMRRAIDEKVRTRGEAIAFLPPEPARLASESPTTAQDLSPAAVAAMLSVR